MGQLKKKKKNTKLHSSSPGNVFIWTFKIRERVDKLSAILFNKSLHYSNETLIPDEEGRYVMVVEIIGGIQRHYLD